MSSWYLAPIDFDLFALFICLHCLWFWNNYEKYLHFFFLPSSLSSFLPSFLSLPCLLLPSFPLPSSLFPLSLPPNIWGLFGLMKRTTENQQLPFSSQVHSLTLKNWEDWQMQKIMKFTSWIIKLDFSNSSTYQDQPSWQTLCYWCIN